MNEITSFRFVLAQKGSPKVLTLLELFTERGDLLQHNFGEFNVEVIDNLIQQLNRIKQYALGAEIGNTEGFDSIPKH